MTDFAGIVVTGGSGRMGQMLINAVQEASTYCTLVGVGTAGRWWAGQDVSGHKAVQRSAVGSIDAVDITQRRKRLLILHETRRLALRATRQRKYDWHDGWSWTVCYKTGHAARHA
jgi:hypothetical protein